MVWANRYSTAMCSPVTRINTKMKKGHTSKHPSPTFIAQSSHPGNAHPLSRGVPKKKRRRGCNTLVYQSCSEISLTSRFPRWGELWNQSTTKDPLAHVVQVRHQLDIECSEGLGLPPQLLPPCPGPCSNLMLPPACTFACALHCIASLRNNILCSVNHYCKVNLECPHLRVQFNTCRVLEALQVLLLHLPNVGHAVMVDQTQPCGVCQLPH